MYTQSCNCLSSKKQSYFTGSIPENLGLLRSITTKSFPEFDKSSLKLSVDFKTDPEYQSQEQFRPISTNIMYFVNSLKNSSTLKLRHSIPNLSVSSERQRHHCQEIIAHYSVSAMPVVSSHLVGGFVGSKSQLGGRQTHGIGVKMWDIIRELVDLVGNLSPDLSSNQNSNNLSTIDKKITKVHKSKGKQNSPIKLFNNTIGDDKPKEIEKYKQTYADVAKSKLPMESEGPSFKFVGQGNDQQSNYCTIDCNKSKSVIEPSLCSKSYSNRDRITSECSADSEDSFIVFEYCEGDDNSIDDDGNSSDNESLLGFFIDEESPSGSSSAPSRKFSFNKSCNKSLKKVRFAEGKSMTQVHPMIVWDYAYRMARKGPWEMLARDSQRFKCRIANTEAILKPVFDPEHRETVFLQRFTNLDS